MTATTMLDRDYHRLVGCHSKVPFEARSVAMRVAKRMHKQRKGPQGVYQCEFCGQFHIGLRAKARRRATS